MSSVLSSLVKNIFFSGISFVIVGLIGLLLVPFIVHSYGMAAYGVIVFVRSFLPSGLIGMFDCGVTEVATKMTARRNTMTQDGSVPSLAPVLILGAAIGIIMAGIIILALPQIPHLLGAAGTKFEGDIHRILLATAGILLVAFPGQAIEGMVRGCEKFLVVRASEITSILTYGGLTLLGIYWKQPYSWVAYAFLMGSLIKTTILAIWVIRQRLISRSELRSVNYVAVKDCVASGMLFTQSKIISTLQTQLPVVLVGIFSGPAGTAAYDVIMRLPRFLKSIMALTVSVVFPVSARLDVDEDKTKLSRLLISGLTMVMFSLYPIISAGIVFAKEIMELWIGAALADYWPWMSLMFGALMTNVLLSYALTVGSVRAIVQKQINLLFFYQAVLQFALSFALVHFLSERAFILGQAVMMLAFFPLQMYSLLQRLEIKNAKISLLILRFMAIGLFLAALFYILSFWFVPNSFLRLIIQGLVWVISYWVLAYLLAFDNNARSQFAKIIRMLH